MDYRVTHVRRYKRRQTLRRQCMRTECHKPAMVAYQLTTPAGFVYQFANCAEHAPKDVQT